jgi:hypothetical protein
MDNFNQAIRTTQVVDGSIYVEAQVAINDEVYTYGQYYSSNPKAVTYAENIPEAVKRFKAFYGPMYLQDVEAQNDTDI